jgi:hypothetical protein
VGRFGIGRLATPLEDFAQGSRPDPNLPGDRERRRRPVEGRRLGARASVRSPDEAWIADEESTVQTGYMGEARIRQHR